MLKFISIMASPLLVSIQLIIRIQKAANESSSTLPVTVMTEVSAWKTVVLQELPKCCLTFAMTIVRVWKEHFCWMLAVAQKIYNVRKMNQWPAACATQCSRSLSRRHPAQNMHEFPWTGGLWTKMILYIKQLCISLSKD